MSSGLYHSGRWQTGQQRMSVRHKYTQEIIGEVALPSPHDIDCALSSALVGARAMAELAAHRRCELLSATASGLRRDRESLARTIAAEAGKPIKYARLEVDRAAQTFQIAAEEARRIHGETLAYDAAPNGTGYFGFWWRKPVGVVGAITPFNFPLNLVAHKIAPAIAAGNAFVLKPAELTPLSSIALLQILLDAGLPDQAAQLLPGSGSLVGQAIVVDPRVNKISFTGSTAVGKQILAQAGIKKVTLELGNSSPAIVAADADLDATAKRLAIGAFAQAGQICISVQRIFCDMRIADALRERLLQATQAIMTGDPMLDATDVGPMISHQAAERAQAWVEEAKNAGARCLIGGQREGAIVFPTLLDQTTPEMKVMCQEIFAPVASLSTYQDFEQAITAANATSYGLQAAVFTQDINRILRSIQQLDFGGVIVNDMPSFRVDHMPYGGNKQSGIGREGVRFAIEEMTNIQTVAIRQQS